LLTAGSSNNQDPAFIEKIRKLTSRGPGWPRRILNDDGYFEAI